MLAAAALALPLAQDAVGRAWVIRRPAVEFPLHPPKPWPLEFPNAQYLPLRWAELDGWIDDDQLAATAGSRR